MWVGGTGVLASDVVNAAGRAVTQMSEVVDLMHDAVSEAQEATRIAARDLKKWAAEAGVGKMETSELTAVDKLMLADTGIAGADTELTEILTADDLERASTRMDQLSLDDETAMERMPAKSETPQERAYLMKALAAGHSVAEIGAFQDETHGKDLPVRARPHRRPRRAAGRPRGAGTDQRHRRRLSHRQ
ncbi:hypothetical protein [Streptomyces sp. NPDC056323]|uniref:hypothetical protein n=1 Tax=Streptomyces sp. NPDC056323 TaxID=3345784 RepID=UPI0035DCA2B8